MMPNHDGFSCLVFPSHWEKPRFKLGDAVIVDGEQGLIVGAFYASCDSCDSKFDTYQHGWWFEVAIPCVIGEDLAKNVTGHHQDVIRPLLAVGNSGIQEEGVCIPSINTLEPLCFGVF